MKALPHFTFQCFECCNQTNEQLKRSRFSLADRICSKQPLSLSLSLWILARLIMLSSYVYSIQFTDRRYFNFTENSALFSSDTKQLTPHQFFCSFFHFSLHLFHFFPHIILWAGYVSLQRGGCHAEPLKCTWYAELVFILLTLPSLFVACLSQEGSRL